MNKRAIAIRLSEIRLLPRQRGRVSKSSTRLQPRVWHNCKELEKNGLIVSDGKLGRNGQKVWLTPNGAVFAVQIGADPNVIGRGNREAGPLASSDINSVCGMIKQIGVKVWSEAMATLSPVDLSILATLQIDPAYVGAVAALSGDASRHPGGVFNLMERLGRAVREADKMKGQTKAYESMLIQISKNQGFTIDPSVYESS